MSFLVNTATFGMLEEEEQPSREARAGPPQIKLRASGETFTVPLSAAKYAQQRVFYGALTPSHKTQEDENGETHD